MHHGLAFIGFLLLYVIVQLYIAWNGWAWVKTIYPVNKISFAVLFLFLSLTFFLSKWFPGVALFQWIGSYWLVVTGYALLLLPLANLFAFFLRKHAFFSHSATFWIGIGVLVVYAVIFAAGSFYAWNPVVRTYYLSIDKPAASHKELKILVASDMHLGHVVGKQHLQKLVDYAEKSKPDLILLPGDIIDDVVQPFIKKEMGSVLGQLEAPLGVYAVLGNHEYYGGEVPQFLAEMDRIGIRVLQDESVFIEDSFYVVGRKDKTDLQRATPQAVTAGLDLSKPVIMMDHQPFQLGETVKSGADLVVSGHTHRGQIAPLQFVTNKVFENDWGYLKKGTMHSIVTSGFGTWGPPIRLGSQSEIVEIILTFE